MDTFSEDAGSSSALSPPQDSATASDSGAGQVITGGQSTLGAVAKPEASRQATTAANAAGLHEALQLEEAPGGEGDNQGTVDEGPSLLGPADQRSPPSTDLWRASEETAGTPLDLPSVPRTGAGEAPPQESHPQRAEDVATEREEMAQESGRPPSPPTEETSGAPGSPQEVQAKEGLEVIADVRSPMEKAPAVQETDAPGTAAVALSAGAESLKNEPHMPIDNFGSSGSIGKQPLKEVSAGSGASQGPLLTESGGFELYTSESSDSDSDADEPFKIAANDDSQPQANPLMDAFPGRAVFLQIDPKKGARTLMCATYFRCCTSVALSVWQAQGDRDTWYP